MGSSRVTATQADASQLKVDASSVAIPVTDNAGSLTVDGSVTVTQATATNLKVDASGVAVPVTDNGGSLTVDGTVAVSGTSTIAGTVTANAGTNLNTSALALDATVGTTNTEVGGLTETAPATDTASSGLNGRLQRIAQRLTSLIAVFNVGAGTEAAAVRVTLPTDGTGKVNAAQSGTWTVQPGNTANTTAWKVDGSAVTQPVSLAANQSVNVAQINGVTATMGNGASGTGVQRVTIANDSTGQVALAAGSAAIGKLTANSGVIIGDVNVVTNIPGTTATSLGKAEDAAHTSGDVGVMDLAVRNDSGAVLAGTTGDYIPLTTNAFGDLRVGSIDPSQQIHKAVNVTTTQTGTDVWSPASGKKIAVTNIIIGSYGTTAARVIVWFGDNVDTTYTAGTDQVLVAASFAPSATAKPGLVYSPANPIYCTTADRELHLTTDAGISLDITVEGFEF